MLKNWLVSALAALFFGSATMAGSGGFSPEDAAQIDILPGWRTSGGTHMTALRVRLAHGWKTYWRAPGEAGIPPRFDWSESENLAAVRFHWPVPSIFEQNGMRSLGYKNELVLPIELTPTDAGSDIRLRAVIEIGVCENICMPVTIRFDTNLGNGTAPDPRIRAAMASRPATAREAGLRNVTCATQAISDGLRLTARIDMPRLGEHEMAVFELPDQAIWVSEASSARKGRTLTATTELVPPSNGPFVLSRADVRITVLSAGRAVDIQGCTG